MLAPAVTSRSIRDLDRSKLDKYRAGVTWRAMLIALILIPINAYWVFYTEIVRYEGHPTTISLFYNCIFIVFCLILVNGRVHRWLPGKELRQGELLTVYVLLNIGSALVGHDAVQVLVPILCFSFQFATPENNWGTLFNSHLPESLTVRDKYSIDRFFQGAGANNSVSPGQVPGFCCEPAENRGHLIIAGKYGAVRRGGG